MKLKRLISIICVFVLIAGIFAFAPAEASGSVTTLIACSDFQHEQGNEQGKLLVKDILSALAVDGVTSADGFLCCGDYDYEYTETREGVDALTEAVEDVVTDEMIFVQGNHDPLIVTPSGNNDPKSDAYGVFVINEDDYMWYNSDEQTIKRTAQNLIDYLNEKISVGYSKPVFVLSHLPLHYCMRTRNDGDGKYANYIFDALNEAGEKGLNIVFMYGHNHSNGWDDYLGGAAVFLKKGDSINIAQKSQTVFKTETLNFTYMNPGFIGYYRNVNGADDALTMSVIEISDSDITFTRYSKDGRHMLKSAGVTNSYKNESGYEPDLTEYDSPQVVELTSVSDKTPIADIIYRRTEGARYQKITDLSDIKDGGKYLLVYNSSSDYIMLPEVATKSNSSGSRTGFDVESTSEFGDGVCISDHYEKLWTFNRSGDKWTVGDGSESIVFESPSGQSATANLSASGDALTIGGTVDAFTFSNGQYSLNYNSRGVINGYDSNPATFYIYEFTGFTVSVSGGTSSVKYALPGQRVELFADESKNFFDKWISASGNNIIPDVYSAQTSFTMPELAVNVSADYHVMTDVPARESTCTANGYTAHKACLNCSYTEGKAEIAVVAHKYTTYVDDKAATCTENATKAASCDFGCGTKNIVEVENTKLGHNMADVAEVAPTCTAAGVSAHKACSRCDHTEGKTAIAALGHDLKDVAEVPATETEDGVSAHKACSRCDHTEGKEVIPATGKQVEIVDTTKVFTDVKAKKWCTNAINYAYSHGFIAGLTETEYGINEPITRGQFITILARIAGVKTNNAANKAATTKFADVKVGKFYTAAIAWASENGVVNGVTDTEFAPDAAIERQQLCVMIVNFAKYMGIELTASEDAITFADATSIYKYARKAVTTCQQADIVNGYNENGGVIFKPTATATRAEAAQILYKFHKDFVL